MEDRLYKLNQEIFARKIAAKKRGPTHDHDPAGRDIPDEEWRQCIPDADRMLSFEVEHTSSGYGHTTVSGKCPTDATVQEVEERFYHWYFGGRDAWVKDGRFGCVIHTD